MIRVHVIKSLLDTDVRTTHELPWDGRPICAIAAQCLPREWSPQAKISIALNGRKLSEQELGYVPADDVELVVVPDPQGLEAGAIIGLIALALTIASSIYYYLSLPELPTDRGDETSPTYSWGGIATEYRQGFPVPIVYGEHDVGGQVIYMSVDSIRFTPPGAQYWREYLYVILALCEGRIDSIGGVQGGLSGEADDLGGYVGQTPGNPIPTDVRINGVRFDDALPLPGARMFVRCGNVDQSQLPAPVFPGVRTTQLVNLDLLDKGHEAIATINATDPIATFAVLLHFPGGLFYTDGSGNIQPHLVEVQIAWRPTGTTQWRLAGGGAPYRILQAWTQSFTEKISVNLPIPPNGPIDIRVTRLTIHDPKASSHIVWSQIVWGLDHSFSYPRTALLGAVVEASERFPTGRPNFTVRLRGKRVRVYDDTHGISTTRHWDLPASGVFAGIWQYPPGKNPAWIAADFLTSPEGLGAFVSDAQVDWPAFRDWADYCDGDVTIGAGVEARFQFDGVLDAPTPAWDWFMRICKAGRATPYIKGTKISIKYEYASGHGFGTNVVPAKIRTQLITTANVREFKVTYLNPSQRPAVLTAQILNAAKDFSQDLVQVEDPDGGFNDPRTINPIGFTKQTVEMFGVTRASQVRREMLYLHRGNRLIRSRCSFEIGPEALAATIGDVIGVQHDCFRPYDAESFAFRLTEAASGTTIKVDHDVVLAPATTYHVHLRQADGTVVQRTITSTSGSYPAGSALTIDASVTCLSAAPAALGTADKVVKDYLILNIGLAENLVRQVDALEWVPAVYSDDDVGGDLAAESQGEIVAPSTTFDAAAPPVPVEAINAVLLSSGRLLIGWAAGVGAQGLRCRVWTRLSGAVSWWLVGEGVDSLEVAPLPVGESYEIAVAAGNRLGTIYEQPELATRITHVAEEFPAYLLPPAVHNVQWTQAPDGWALSWDPVEFHGFAYYEVRRGEEWAGGQVVYRGEMTSFIHRDPPYGSASYMVAARHQSGLYSDFTRAQPNPAYRPDGTVQVAALDEMIDELPGTKVRVEQDPTTLAAVLVAGECEGSYTSRELDPGFGEETTAWWSIYHWAEEHDGAVVDDWDFPVDSGESVWRTVNAREASAATPGVDWDLEVDDLAVAVDELPDELLGGHWRGSPGSHTQVVIESRFETDAGWSAWAPHQNGWRRALKMQARALLYRDDVERDVVLGILDLRCFV